MKIYLLRLFISFSCLNLRSDNYKKIVIRCLTIRMKSFFGVALKVFSLEFRLSRKGLFMFENFNAGVFSDRLFLFTFSGSVKVKSFTLNTFYLCCVALCFENANLITNV